MRDCDLLVSNVHVATCARGAEDSDIDDGALAVRDGRIAWVGARRDLPAEFHAREELDGRCGWLTPALIDCHTHLVYAGNRAREFEQRLAGMSYAEIARGGGGIVSTVKATRGASEDELFSAASRRLARLADEAVMTVEIKSGYGLDPPTELKLLRVARRLADASGIEVRATLLAAHTLPPEYVGRADDACSRPRAPMGCR